MTRLSSLISCATLAMGFALVGCSSGSDGGGGNIDPLTLVPVDDPSTGWMVDMSIAKPGIRAMTGTTLKEVTNLIDGGAEVYFRDSFAPKLFMLQYYTNKTLPAAPPDPLGNKSGATLMLYVLQMPSKEQAQGLYADLLKTTGTDHTRWAGTDRDWKDPSSPLVGDGSRIQDTGAQWWVNFYKGAYYAEVMIAPSYGPAPDYNPSDPDLMAETLRFSQAIAAGM